LGQGLIPEGPLRGPWGIILQVFRKRKEGILVLRQLGEHFGMVTFHIGSERRSGSGITSGNHLVKLFEEQSYSSGVGDWSIWIWGI